MKELLSVFRNYTEQVRSLTPLDGFFSVDLYRIAEEFSTGYLLSCWINREMERI